jgi:hypothetical protein
VKETIVQRMIWIVIAVFMIHLAGCGGGSGSGGNSNPITSPVGLSVSPTPASVGVGDTQTFAAAVTGSTNTGVTWRVQEGTAGGAIDANGNYTAPGKIGVYHVVAASQADPGKTVTVPVTVHTLVSISPPATTLAIGATQTFTAAVAGSSNTGVTWSVQEGAAGGAIDANGRYTAPNTTGIYHVVGASQADGTQGNATVTIQAMPSTGGAAVTVQ